MKVKELLTEIRKIRKDDFKGGKNYIGMYVPHFDKPWKKLPGDAGFYFNVKEYANYKKTIYIIEKSNPNIVIGLLELERSNLSILEDFKNSWQVIVITVDEDYRGKKIGLALYGIALSILNLTLVSGDNQTPAGRKSWVNIAQVPGVEVKGLVGLKDDEKVPKFMDEIMELGGQYMGKDATHWKGEMTYWAFDVIPGKNELQPAVKNELSHIYGKQYIMLYARWVG